MAERLQKVPVSKAQELVKNIRLLAMSGRLAFREYLQSPLMYAGWNSERIQQNHKKLLERISRESADPSFLHTIAPRCKRLISSSVNESFSILGEVSIFFLEKMQIHIRVSASPESVEFVKIIDPPLTEFMQKSTEKSEALFKSSIESLDGEKLRHAMEPVRLSSSDEKVKFDTEIKRLYDNILIASKYNNIPKCKKLLSGYMIRYIDSPEYARDDVDRLITALDKREEGFEQELKETLSIDLYFRITKAILAGDIAQAIQSIRKYAYIFEGNPATRHFYDIDRLERILYQMISDKKLWDELKK